VQPRCLAAAIAANVVAISTALALDPSLPPYQTAPGISGQIKSIGSDTLNDAMMLWAEGFKSRYPNVKIDIEGKGSATAPPALLQGISQFGPMSRLMTSEEFNAFETKYGYKVSAFRVAVDALAVYVHKDNPIRCLTLPQLNQIFSSTRKVTGGNNIENWGELGLGGEWAARPIQLYGRNSLSGTYEFFQDMVLYSGDYKPEVRPQLGSEAVVQNVAKDKFAMGYSGIGYKTDGVRPVPLGAYSGGQCYDTSAESTLSGKYPIARYLYIFVNKKPDQPLDARRAEFIKYILSRDGQIQTEKGGYYAITNDIREDELKKFGIASLAN